jgi:AraC-like DNA-binding protein
MRDALGKLLVHHAVGAPVSKLARAPLGQVRDVLEADFARNVTLDELAQLAGLNAFTLLRAFRRTYGLPPHAYQLQVRLRHAKRLLRQGETPVRAALESGFAASVPLGRVKNVLDLGSSLHVKSQSSVGDRIGGLEFV